MRVKRLPADVFHIRIIEIVSDKRKTDVLHMDADLMGTAGLENERDKAVPVFFAYFSEMSDSVFTVLIVDPPFDE